MYALDLELPTKLGLRSFHGTRGAIRGNSRAGPLTQSLPNPPGKKKKKKEGEDGLRRGDASLYGAGQNVPWVIPKRLFTCKFKYTGACTDKTLPRSFLTLLLLTSISHIPGCVRALSRHQTKIVGTCEAAVKINSQHFKTLSEKENIYTAGRRGCAVFWCTICFLVLFCFFSYLSLRHSSINSTIV